MAILHNGNESMDDLIFANRNKQYGAYDLRKSYARHLFVGFLVVVALAVLPLLLRLSALSIHPSAANNVLNVTNLVDMLQPPKFIIEVQPTMPQAGAKANTRSTDEQIFRIVSDEEVNHQLNAATPNHTPVESIYNLGNSMFGNTTDFNGNAAIGNATGNSYLPFTATLIPDLVEQMPEFVGGEEALKKYISSQLQHPKRAIEARVEGKVVVSFIVDENGKVNHVALVKSLGLAYLIIYLVIQI